MHLFAKKTTRESDAERFYQQFPGMAMNFGWDPSLWWIRNLREHSVSWYLCDPEKFKNIDLLRSTLYNILNPDRFVCCLKGGAYRVDISMLTYWIRPSPRHMALRAKANPYNAAFDSLVVTPESMLFFNEGKLMFEFYIGRYGMGLSGEIERVIRETTERSMPLIWGRYNAYIRDSTGWHVAEQAVACS